MTLALLSHFSSSAEAQVARSFLRSHGLLAFVFDAEDQCDTSWPAGNIRVMVAEDDLEEAMSILESVGA